MSTIAKTIPIMPNGPKTILKEIDNSRKKMIIKIHLTHICGHWGESSLRFDINIAIKVVKIIVQEIEPAIISSSKAALTSNITTTNGRVTNAIVGLFNPR
jgi:hypothetical protein